MFNVEFYTMVGVAAVTWIAGGLFFLDATARYHAASGGDAGLENTLDGLRRFDPAAWTALILLLAIWPIVFVGLKLGKVLGR